MFDISRLGPDPLTPVERRLGTLLVQAEVRRWPAGVGVEPGWPSLLWPDRVHEVSVGQHGQVEEPDETARRRAHEVELLERGALHLERARLAERELRRAAARRARAVADFTRARPAAALDRAPGEVGAASAASQAARPATLTEVSEWAADEAAVGLGMSPSGAVLLLERCLVLDEQLPDTRAELEAGEIGWEHALVMVDVLGPMSAPEKRREAERRLLARARGRSPAQLRQAARRLVLRIDAAAAARRAARAMAARRVRYHAGEDGMGGLEAQMALPVVRACYNALSAYADACRAPGDERSKDERMADCLADLVLRPGATDRPPVQVSLTVVAPAATLLGGDEPAEIDGEPVPAAVVRELAYALGLMPRPVRVASEGADASVAAAGEAATPDPAGDAATAGTASEAAAGGTAGGVDAAGTGSSVTDGDVAALGALLGTARVDGTGLAHRPRIAVVDELDGTLLALTDAAGLRRGEALGPPPESPGYRPGNALDRFVRLRDRRCRFPGCRARPRKCDLDHVVAHPLGPTAVCNLCALCEHHHRLKHQAPGWTLIGTGDGGLTWRTPGGIDVTTRPPRHGADDDVPDGAPQIVIASTRRPRTAASGTRAGPAPHRGRKRGGRLPGILDLLRTAADRPRGAGGSLDAPPPPF